MRTKLGNRGFTLTELMVVVAIIAIMTTIAVPSYISMMPHLRLKGAARDVASALRLARMTAISKNQNQTVAFNLASDSFSYQNLNSSSWKDVDLYAGPAFKDNPLSGSDVVFHSNGTTDITGNDAEEVYIKNLSVDTPGENQVYRVRIEAVTGIINIQKWNGFDWEDA